MIRKIIILSVFIAFCALNLKSDNLMDNIRNLMGKKEYQKALKVIDKAIAGNPGNATLKRLKIDIHLEAGENEKALNYIDSCLKKNSGDRFMMSQNIRVSLISKKNNRALEAAIAFDNSAPSKDPAGSFMIARIYLKQIAPDEAMVWLNESLERGFIDYMLLRSNEFSSLHKRADFLELVGKMKLSAGVGNRAKSFTINNMNENTSISLNHYRGKVVVLMFTGSWSRSAWNEVKNLEKHYLELKSKGLEVIEINLDTKMRYVKNQKRPWVMAVSLKGTKDPVALLYGVKSVPSVWVIGKEGYVRSFGLRGKELIEVLHKLSAE